MGLQLVTGGAGFIGSHIVTELVRRGSRVRVLDNLSTGQQENLDPVKREIEFIRGDLRDPGDVLAAVRDVETVFHLAAFISVPQSMREPQICYDINVQGTLNLMNACRFAGVRRLVLSSTCAVYGDCPDLPIAEQAVLAPLSPYAASKQVNEVYAGMYTRSLGLPVTVLRYFNVYGPRQSPDSPYAAAIPIFVRQLLSGNPPKVYGDGQQKRDFVFVQDVVRANILASESKAAPGNVYNVCTGKETSLLQLLDTLAEILPDSPAHRFEKPRPGDIQRSCGDPTRAARELGFRAETSLIHGLDLTIQAMRDLAHPVA